MHDTRPSLFYLCSLVCGLVELEQNSPCAVVLSCVTLVHGYLSLRSCLRSCGQVLGTPLAEGIVKFVPKISNFYEWRKPSWKCPLPRDVREKIIYKHLKHRLWNRYIETRDLHYLTKCKKIRNNICIITRQKQITEPNEIAKAAKSNPKFSFGPMLKTKLYWSLQLEIWRQLTME